MDRTFASGAAGSAPSAPASPSTGYPTAGNPGSGTPATKPGAWWYYMITEEIRKVITDAGLTPDHTNLTQLKAALDALYVSRSGGGYMMLADEKAQGTAGGSSVAGVQTRVLNTVRRNTISGASLASNQITLPAGTYRVRGSAPSCSLDLTRAYLYNVTDAATVILGTSEQGVGGAEVATTRSWVEGSMTIAATKVFELRHYTGAAISSTGLGAAVSNGGNEVYSTLEIIKEA